LQLGAVVQQATAEGDHYRLTMQLEGVVTAELLRKLAGDLKYSRLEAASGYTSPQNAIPFYVLGAGSERELTERS
jgi:hypothetical protein